MAPWFVRDYETFHQFIPIRSGFGLELYIGNSADSLHWVDRGLHPNHSDAELREYTERGELAYMAHKAQQGKEYIRSHPGAIRISGVAADNIYLDGVLEF